MFLGVRFYTLLLFVLMCVINPIYVLHLSIQFNTSDIAGINQFSLALRMCVFDYK